MTSSRQRVADGHASASATASSSREPREGEAPLALNNDFAAMHEVVLAPLPRLLEAGGPFPGSDPDRRRQGPVVGGVRRARGAGAWPADCRRHCEERRAALHARSGGCRSRWRDDSPALLLIQRIRDEAHRFAVTFHRQSRARKRDLRSELDAIAASARGAARRC